MIDFIAGLVGSSAEALLGTLRNSRLARVVLIALIGLGFPLIVALAIAPERLGEVLDVIGPVVVGLCLLGWITGKR